MWASILAIFPTIAGWINLVIGWFAARKQAESDQSASVDLGLHNHEQDGKQSVSDVTSSDAQNSALDAAEKEMDSKPKN